MSNTRKIGVNQLKIGMYVAQLDRPWLETPFLFQGFYIREQDEIRDLREYCSYVHVLSDDSPDHPASGVRARGLDEEPREHAAGGRRFRFPTFLRPGEKRTGKKEQTRSRGDRFTRPGMFYKNTETLEKELKHATGIHDDAVVTVHEVMRDLQGAEKLDVERLETAVTPMVSSILRNPAALSCLVRLQQKDDYLYHHSLASLVWATVLGRHIGLSYDDLNVIALGAMLFDVGKTRIPDGILHKPGKLNDDERKLMRRHVEYGIEILNETKGMDQRVIDMVTYHHERYNGTGYPRGLKGSQIPVFGRIAGIVDAYDAMISPRPYSSPMSSYDAFRELRGLADVEFQAELIDQFTQAIGVFPIATLVELNTGEVGVVTKQHRTRRLRPEVMIIMSAEKEFLESFRVVDLSKESVDKRGHHRLWIERGLAPGSFGIDPAEFFLD